MVGLLRINRDAGKSTARKLVKRTKGYARKLGGKTKTDITHKVPSNIKISAPKTVPKNVRIRIPKKVRII